MIDQKHSVFLLGGHDLEMITIRELLDEQGISYFDESPKWGAKLSDYEKRLNENPDAMFYAVELSEDIDLPKNYQRIDHHNDYSDKEASILQVLKLLDIEPSREQELIAENDSRHILGMECIGASNEDISRIRKKDRRAQGADNGDDTAGRNDARSRKTINDVDIVCATTSYFSCITDALYIDEKSRNKCIISNDVEMVFYGFPLQNIKDLCRKQNIDEKKYYYGGGDSGFFGFKKKVLTKEKMLKFKDELLVEKNELYSSHIFMFPFRFDYNEKGFDHEFDFYKDIDIEKRVDVDKLNESLKNDDWKYEKFDIENTVDKRLLYSEYAYFYGYARDSIYNTKDKFNKTEISNFYRKDIYDKGTFQLNVAETKYRKSKSYDLNISGIMLRVFSSGVAIITIELDNYKYFEFDDILLINDFGRRIYPQFIGENGVSDTKNSFLADSIVITNEHGDNRNKITENFKDCNYTDVDIGNHIMDLLGKNTFSKERSKEGKFHIQPSLDDRMFVLSWYGNDKVADRLQDCEPNYTMNDDWYKYLFNDTGMCTVQNESMKKELIKCSTYDRWSNFGALTGITRYSFMMLSSSENTLKINDASMIIDHSKTMYFQMVILLLAMRTSILRFSDEIAPLSTFSEGDNLEKLYERYLTFYNRLYFKEVTHQDQGIELFDLGLKQMKIPEHMEKLDSKFTKLFDYANLKLEKKRNDRLENISKLGAVFLPPSLLAGIYGMNVFNFNKTQETMYIAFFAMLLSAIVGYISISKKWNWALFISAVLMLVIMLGSLFWIGEDKNTPSVNIKEPVTVDITKSMETIKEANETK